MGEDKYPPAAEWMPKELLAYEKEALGFYISGHPLDRYGGEIRRFTTATAPTAWRRGERAEVILGGVVSGFQERRCQERHGQDTPSSTWRIRPARSSSSSDPASSRSSATLLVRDEPMLVTGTVDAPWTRARRCASGCVFVDAKPLATVRADKSSLLDIRLNADVVSEDQIKALEKVLRSHTGGCRTMLRMEIPKRSETVLDLGDDYKVAATDELLARIEQIFGARVAVLR